MLKTEEELRSQVILTRTFVSKVVCPSCGKIFYGADDTEVLGSLGGHMTASHNGSKKRVAEEK